MTTHNTSERFQKRRFVSQLMMLIALYALVFWGIPDLNYTMPVTNVLTVTLHLMGVFFFVGAMLVDILYVVKDLNLSRIESLDKIWKEHLGKFFSENLSYYWISNIGKSVFVLAVIMFVLITLIPWVVGPSAPSSMSWFSGQDGPAYIVHSIGVNGLAWTVWAMLRTATAYLDFEY